MILLLEKNTIVSRPKFEKNLQQGLCSFIISWT